MLMDDVTRRQVAPMGSSEWDPAPVVGAKFFAPWGQWTWYVIEHDGADTCYGLVVGVEAELGYFSLRELEGVQGPGGLAIERDVHFRPQPLAEVQRRLARGEHV